jgi:hypothetical protein
MQTLTPVPLSPKQSAGFFNWKHDVSKPQRSGIPRALGLVQWRPIPYLPVPLWSSPNDLHVQQEQQGSQAGHQQSKLPWRQALNAWLFV